MSVYITTHVWHNSQHRGTALLLVLALADQANDDGICWPSVGTLAAKTRLSERTVQNLIPEVLATGEVQVIRESRGGHSPRVYRVVAPAPPSHGGRQARGAKSAPQLSVRGADSSPRDPGVQSSVARGADFDAGVQKTEPGVQFSASRGATVCTQTVINHQVEPSIEPYEPSRVRAREISLFHTCPCCDRDIDHRGRGHALEKSVLRGGMQQCRFMNQTPGQWAAALARASP